jgi:hypothetical protein
VSRACHPDATARFKTQIGGYSKRKSGRFKTQIRWIQNAAGCAEPLQSEPFLLEPVKTEPSLAKTQNQDDFFSPKGKKENPKATPQGVSPLPTPKGTVGSAVARPSLRVTLKEEVAATLRLHGCPPAVLNLLELYTHFANILNGNTPSGCSNPVTAYATFAGRNPKFANLWMPTAKSETLTGEDSDFVEEALFMKKKREQQAPEERDREDSSTWFCVKFVSPLSKAQPEDFGIRTVEDPNVPGCESYDKDDILNAYLHEMRTANTYLAKQWREQRGIEEEAAA